MAAVAGLVTFAAAGTGDGDSGEAACRGWFEDTKAESPHVPSAALAAARESWQREPSPVSGLHTAVPALPHR